MYTYIKEIHYDTNDTSTSKVENRLFSKLKFKNCSYYNDNNNYRINKITVINTSIAIIN